MASQEDWKKIHEAKDKYCSTLLKNVHVNYVGVSLKKKAGQSTDIPTIIVAVKKKLLLAELSEEEKIPAFLDGVPTDVIEGDLNLVKLEDILNQPQDVDVETKADLTTAPMVEGNVDPFKYSDTITSGMTIAKYSKPRSYGTVGCFVTVTGSPKLSDIIVGESYLVTCKHVVRNASLHDQIIIPATKREGRPPAKNDRATYINGTESDPESIDVAAVKLNDGVDLKNEVPTATSEKSFTGVLDDWPIPETQVFKYGAQTWYTEGYVNATNVSSGGYEKIMTINGKKISSRRHAVVADGGDSGSVVVISSDSEANITGLLFAVNDDTKIAGGYTQCYAYRMDQQLSTLAGSWELS